MQKRQPGVQPGSRKRRKAREHRTLGGGERFPTAQPIALAVLHVMEREGITPSDVCLLSGLDKSRLRMREIGAEQVSARTLEWCANAAGYRLALVKLRPGESAPTDPLALMTASSRDDAVPTRMRQLLMTLREVTPEQMSRLGLDSSPAASPTLRALLPLAAKRGMDAKALAAAGGVTKAAVDSALNARAELPLSAFERMASALGLGLSLMPLSESDTARWRRLPPVDKPLGARPVPAPAFDEDGQEIDFNSKRGKTTLRRIEKRAGMVTDASS